MHTTRRITGFLFAVLAGCMCACGADGTPESDTDMTEEILYENNRSAWVQFTKTLEECVEETDCIVRGTVTEIADGADAYGYQSFTFAPTDVYLCAGTDSDSLTLDALDTLLPDDMIGDDHMITLRGRFEGARSTDRSRVPVEEGGEYILFLCDWENTGWRYWTQPSLRLCEDGSVRPLIRYKNIYEDFEDADAVIAYFEALN